LNQEFLKKSEQEEYLTRYNRKFYLRYFSDALQVVEHLRQVASVYYDKDKANEIVQMFQTLSDQLTELEEQVYQTTGSTDIPTE
jgi:hypothetical protein